jgi:hypothetical protein
MDKPTANAMTSAARRPLMRSAAGGAFVSALLWAFVPSVLSGEAFTRSHLEGGPRPEWNTEADFDQDWTMSGPLSGKRRMLASSRSRELYTVGQTIPNPKETRNERPIGPLVFRVALSELCCRLRRLVDTAPAPKA